MVGVMDQSYNLVGHAVNADDPLATKGNHGSNKGFGLNDNSDDCDCKALILSDVCGKGSSAAGDAEGN